MTQRFLYFSLTIFFGIVFCLSNVNILEAKSYWEKNSVQQTNETQSIDKERTLAFSTTKSVGQPAGRTSKNGGSSVVSSVSHNAKFSTVSVNLLFCVRCVLQLFYAANLFSISKVQPLHLDCVLKQYTQPLYLTFCKLRN